MSECVRLTGRNNAAVSYSPFLSHISGEHLPLVSHTFYCTRSSIAFSFPPEGSYSGGEQISNTSVRQPSWNSTGLSRTRCNHLGNNSYDMEIQFCADVRGRF